MLCSPGRLWDAERRQGHRLLPRQNKLSELLLVGPGTRDRGRPRIHRLSDSEHLQPRPLFRALDGHPGTSGSGVAATAARSLDCLLGLSLP